jgi:phosphoribosylaminoimidazolecarboxamide formyltransferase/IMP cyclohydrolase
MPRAIISVSDKAGVVEFSASLADLGWEIVSTGGTAAALREGNVPVTGVGQVTDFPEMLGGRVKTLHPLVHAGILARQRVTSDMEQLREAGIAKVDLVAVNLYPFRETIARESVTLAGALEQIDIGGPTMLRAAAKNHDSVWPVCDPADYERVLEAIRGGEDETGLRRTLATKVFRHTATYDAAIAGYLGASDREADRDLLPPELMTSLTRVQSLRYGENPDQQAAFYRDASRAPRGIPALEQLHGKELSYNNLLDVDGALGAISSFWDSNRPACVIVKHTTPCGIAVGRSPLEAYQKALACDPISAFGSVIAFTEPVTEAVAEVLVELFVECVVAPGYAEAALQILQAKKSLRILRPGELEDLRSSRGHLWSGLEARGVRGGLLVQSAPESVKPVGLADAPSVTVPTSRAPSENEWADLAFAWTAVQSVKSNAILLAREGASIGIGAGQMSRVDAVRLAVQKARDGEHELQGSVLASDAFFPFRDGVDAAADAGVTAIVQPGGSVRDEEAVAAADERGLTMVLTGRRLFRH